MYTLPKDHVLLLKTVNEDMSSYDGFVWPSSGMVKSTTWNPDPNECEGGLYGWLWGVGNYSLKRKGKVKWIVFAAEINSVVEMSGKAKCPKGEVVFVGTYVEAYHLIRKYAPKTTESSATGFSGHASATGNSGHASATGNSGHASATGNFGHASATGDFGHASATGDCGHASATGDSGHASATGYSGHASATGNFGCAVAIGYYSTGSAGPNGFLVLTYYSESENRRKALIGYVGIDIEAGVIYKVEDEKFVKA